MKKKHIILVIAILLTLFVIVKFVTTQKQEETLFQNTNLIQQQIKNVGKLVVTEGHFSEVITYKDNKKYFLDFLSFQKKALLVINAEVTVAYDLRQIRYTVDENNKTVTIRNIPDPEIKINPDIQFYDINQSRLNPFTGADYNKISQQVKANMVKKVETSTLKSNAQNRLISELQKLLILTNSMGWKLEYKNQVIEPETIDKIVL